MADEGTYSYAGRGDSRTRAWHPVPLEGFVGRLADVRKECKRRAKATGSAEDQALDGSLKLMVNTLYGVMVSRFFAVNTVVANNITARARVGVWMMAKALGLRQTITDGGIYDPAQVCTFRGTRRPGLDTLSRPRDWPDARRGRRYVPLAGLDWPSLIRAHGPDPLPADLDGLALTHVRNFWHPYGLDFPFRLEHKTDNTFTAAAYWSKGDHALRRRDGKIHTALRGKDKRLRTDRKNHPTFDLLGNILDGRYDFPTDLSYPRGGRLTVGKWLQAQRSKGYPTLKGLRPGDDIPPETYTARYNNTHAPLADVAVYRRRRDRKKNVRGRPVRWFERFAPEGIAAVHRKMCADELR
jgi:hypothetical protein